MADAVLLQSINREQLATATDRLLFGGRVAPQRFSRGSQAEIQARIDASAARRLAQGTGVFAVGQARASKHAPVAYSRLARPLMAYARRPSGGHRLADCTMPMRRAKPALGLAVVVPTVVGLAIGLAALL